jgi:nucleoporin POM152
VVDESGLEVRRKQSEALVVDCPRAEIKSSADHRCKGELSNLVLALYGSPPFKLKYSRTVNSEDRAFSFQSIQPENWVSPVKGDDDAGALVVRQSGDVSWARAQHIEVPLNESLNTLGRWIYLMEEVQDAFGNSVNYTLTTEYGERVVASKYKHIEQVFTVHPRPKASLATKDSPCTIRVAHGKEARLPIAIDDSEGPYTLSTLFTPLEELPPNGEHSANALVRKELLKTSTEKYEIIEPGLYSLQAISSRFCAGEVLEPSSCLLVNPPVPTLSLSSENIYDSCAGNPIGLQVDLDLIGTPPFEVSYDIVSSNHRKKIPQTVSIDGLRHQLTLKPTKAGHYKYRFNAIKDSLYNQQTLDHTKLFVEQDVRPPASARFNDAQVKRNACLGEGVPFDISLLGEGPWTLEYEVVHNGKRSKYRIEDIQDPSHTIYVNELNDGGEYIVALISVQDKTRCKVLLSEEAKINVRQQLPKAAFAPIDGRYMVTTLEGKKVSLPLRLTGQPPWSVEYRRKDEVAPVLSARLDSNNAMLDVRESGSFEILNIHDAACRGIVEKSASTFDVEWVARPSLRVAEGALVEFVDGRHVKKDVCEGDDDVTEIMLQGEAFCSFLYEAMPDILTAKCRSSAILRQVSATSDP